MFTSQPNLITESGVDLSLHPNSHYQIISAKFNLEIHYRPPCFCDIWHYQDSNTDLTDLFNSFFAKQCFLIINSSELPLNVHYTTEKHLKNINFSNSDIEKIIQNLDPNKAHGHEKISICMIKICCKSICKPLQHIFSECISIGMEESQCSPS